MTSLTNAPIFPARDHYSMEAIFLLAPEYRVRFLQHAAQLLRCVYICIWSPYPEPTSNHLACIDACLREEHDGGLTNTLFEQYRASFCTIVTGCVPGWAFKDGLPYFELQDSALMSSSSLQVQQQFYQESGIKTAIFLGCQNGEIELGMTTTSPVNFQVNVHQVFSEDFIQQSLLAFIGQPSSSSSSLPSRSIGSPEDSSMINIPRGNTQSLTSESTASETPFIVPPPHQLLMQAYGQNRNLQFIGQPSSSSSSLPSRSIGSPEDSSMINIPRGSTQSLTSESTASETPFIVPPPHQLLMQAYGQNRNLQFPTPASDEQAMASAILAVISSPTTPSSSLTRVGERAGWSRGAFKAYKPGLGPRVEPIKTGGVGSQRMVKAALDMLKRMYLMQYQTKVQAEAVARPTGSQLHHMISERKRREKLNESFEALRKLLPPGSKKDKASVLSKTKDYLSTLKAQINELEEKNKNLEMQLIQPNQTQETKTQEVGESSERIQIEVTRAPESTSASQRINLRIIVREECDMADLIIRVLGCLKEIGAFKLVSMDATSSDTPRFARAELTLQVTAHDYEEASLKEAVKKVVEDAVAHLSEKP